VQAYPWDGSCTCPCLVSIRWYVNFAWIVCFGVAYFLYLVEGIFMHALLVKMSCQHSLIGQTLVNDFSSETLRFVRRVRGRNAEEAIRGMQDAPPVFLMRLDTYRSKRHYRSGGTPLKRAAARMKMTFWRDESARVAGLSGQRHAKIWLKKTLAFDGFSTATFFDTRRAAFLKKHRAHEPGTFQVYKEDFQVPQYQEIGIWSQPRNVLIGSLPYLLFTFGGLSWFYRMFVELATTPLNVEVVKLMSMNDRSAVADTCQWRLVRWWFCGVVCDAGVVALQWSPRPIRTQLAAASTNTTRATDASVGVKDLSRPLVACGSNPPRPSNAAPLSATSANVCWPCLLCWQPPDNLRQSESTARRDSVRSARFVTPTAAAKSVHLAGHAAMIDVSCGTAH
jgi:hypothetical protein